MAEEEPMDISWEGDHFMTSHPYEQRAKSVVHRSPRRENFQKGATIASSSPARFKTDLLQLQRDLESLSPDLFTEKRKLENAISPARMRRLNARSDNTRRRIVPKSTKASSLNDEVENEKKREGRSLFQRTRNKFMIWAVVIAICFAISLKLHGSSCQFSVDFYLLNRNLDKHVFGQHIAKEMVLSSLRGYLRFSKSQNNTDMKPLVFSFHGWTGVGKNLMTKIFMKSVQNKKVKVFSVPTHFAHSSQDQVYSTSMSAWVKSNITECEVSIFVFDEMDKATDGLIAGLHTTLMDLRTQKLNNTWVIFVFLSNSKGSKINNMLFSALAEGKTRESLKYEVFEPLLKTDFENEWYADLHREGLIDIFVPFLPLSRKHVYQCIERDLRLKRTNPKQKLVERIAEQMNFFRPKGLSEDYSTTGCKRVTDKVDLVTVPE